MKEVSDMNRHELLEYFKEKKLNGASYSSFANIFRINNIDDDTRKWIINNLDTLEKTQKEQADSQKKSKKRVEGVINLLIGLAIMVIGVVMYRESVRAGIVFIFNILLWGAGGILTLRGLLTIVATIFQDNSYRR